MELVRTSADLGESMVSMRIGLIHASDAFLDRHDRLAMDKLVDLVSAVDAVVLAQSSMTGIIPSLPENACNIAILSSPRLAIESLAKQIQKSD